MGFPLILSILMYDRLAWLQRFNIICIVDNGACDFYPVRWYSIIIVIAWLPGNVNYPCPWPAPLDSGWFTAINSWPHSITSYNVLLSSYHQ